MKVLVTGGQGYLGAAISKSLSESGFEVTCFDRTGKNIDDKSTIRFIKGNILSKSDLSFACKGIDTVLHLAAMDKASCMKNPLDAAAVNGLGTRNALIAAQSCNAKRFIYLSTFHVYGDKEGTLHENILPNPSDDYAITKLLGEHYCMMNHGSLSVTVLRPSNIFGYSDSNSGKELVVNDLCIQCYKNKVIELRTAGQKRNFVSIKDVIKAIYLILNSDVIKVKSKVFNVGGIATLSIAEIAQKISEVYKHKFGKEVKISSKQDTGFIGRKFEFSYKSMSKLGYKPNSIFEEEVDIIFSNMEKKQGTT